MRHGSLFTGIGGFDLAAQWMGWENVFQVEWDAYCQKVLTKNFPNVKRFGDIRDFDGTQYRGLIDILTGGFPCQPFSVAGKQKGKGDDRHLWPEMFRVIREVRSPFIVGENVPGIIGMELENICLALEGEGYEVQPFIIPSASVGAWDKRERVWIVAYNHSFRRSNEQKENRQPLSNRKRDYQAQKQKRGEQQCRIMQSDTITADSNGKRLENRYRKQVQRGAIWEEGTPVSQAHINDTRWREDWTEVASELCRSNARVSNRVDRIKALGNSVNPYVPYQIFKAIEQIKNNL